MTKNINKSLARYYSVQAIYQKMLSSMTFNQIIDEFSVIEDREIFFNFEKSIKTKDLDVDIEYFIQIIRNLQKNETKIIYLIENNLSEKWKLDRLPILLNCILLSAVSEITLTPKLSLGIIASEYIILTDTFFLEKESSFVNAVLSNIYKIKMK